MNNKCLLRTTCGKRNLEKENRMAKAHSFFLISIIANNFFKKVKKPESALIILLAYNWF